MINNRIPPLGLLPRHFWLRERVIECIKALSRYENEEDWNTFRQQIKIFSEELSYCVNEWDKYYPEEK